MNCDPFLRYSHSFLLMLWIIISVSARVNTLVLECLRSLSARLAIPVRMS